MSNRARKTRDAIAGPPRRGNSWEPLRRTGDEADSVSLLTLSASTAGLRIGLKMGAKKSRAVAVIASALAGLVLAAAPVSARVHKLAPPGNSAIGQYLEVIPTAAGGQPTSNLTGSGKSGSSSAISASTRRALGAQGALGSADARFVQGTGPSRHTSPRPKALAVRPVRPALVSSPSPVSSVLKSLAGSSGSGGLGLLLPILLVGTAVGGGALALWRHRRAA